MRKLIKLIFFLMLMGVLIYSLYDRFHIATLVDDMIHDRETTKDLDFVNEVYSAMLEGRESVELQYFGKLDDMNWFTEWVIDEVYKIDDGSTSDDYDYLKFKTESIFTHISGYGNLLTVTYDFVYNESRAETDMVNDKIEELFIDWDIYSLSNYDKVKIIHDYIINNASYDTSLLMYSAYDNLIKHRSTCQGYTSIGYKMLTEAGIPCRIISGIGDGESHGWNIVKVNNNWYNMDLTWDDPLAMDGTEYLVYDFFLKSEEDFEGHLRDESYNTNEFKSNHNIALDSYN